jgi:TorA maturation chaperone TorD
MKRNNKTESMTTVALELNLEPSNQTAMMPDAQPVGVEIDEEQVYRASAYSLLAALLRASPDRSLLEHLCQLSPATDADNDDLLLAMSTLALSARNHREEEIEGEYHDLFIGLGKGEVVPYASWYLTGFLMEQPLSDLRDDLRALGFERNADIHEPEDHAAALCEVISIMISDNTSLSRQKQFFEAHMQTWIGRFFEDLASANSAVFYKSVARFGAAFIDLEQSYISMQS